MLNQNPNAYLSMQQKQQTQQFDPANENGVFAIPSYSGEINNKSDSNTNNNINNYNYNNNNNTSTDTATATNDLQGFTGSAYEANMANNDDRISNNNNEHNKNKKIGRSGGIHRRKTDIPPPPAREETNFDIQDARIVNGTKLPSNPHQQNAHHASSLRSSGCQIVPRESQNFTTTKERKEKLSAKSFLSGDNGSDNNNNNNSNKHGLTNNNNYASYNTFNSEKIRLGPVPTTALPSMNEGLFKTTTIEEKVEGQARQQLLQQQQQGLAANNTERNAASPVQQQNMQQQQQSEPEPEAEQPPTFIPLIERTFVRHVLVAPVAPQPGSHLQRMSADVIRNVSRKIFQVTTQPLFTGPVDRINQNNIVHVAKTNRTINGQSSCNGSRPSSPQIAFHHNIAHYRNTGSKDRQIHSFDQQMYNNNNSLVALKNASPKKKPKGSTVVEDDNNKNSPKNDGAHILRQLLHRRRLCIDKQLQQMFFAAILSSSFDSCHNRYVHNRAKMAKVLMCLHPGVSVVPSGGMVLASAKIGSNVLSSPVKAANSVVASIDNNSFISGTGINNIPSTIFPLAVPGGILAGRGMLPARSTNPDGAKGVDQNSVDDKTFIGDNKPGIKSPTQEAATGATLVTIPIASSSSSQQHAAQNKNNASRDDQFASSFTNVSVVTGLKDLLRTRALVPTTMMFASNDDDDDDDDDHINNNNNNNRYSSKAPFLASADSSTPTATVNSVVVVSKALIQDQATLTAPSTSSRRQHAISGGTKSFPSTKLASGGKTSSQPYNNNNNNNNNTNNIEHRNEDDIEVCDNAQNNNNSIAVVQLPAMPLLAFSSKNSNNNKNKNIPNKNFHHHQLQLKKPNYSTTIQIEDIHLKEFIQVGSRSLLTSFLDSSPSAFDHCQDSATSASFTTARYPGTFKPIITLGAGTFGTAYLVVYKEQQTKVNEQVSALLEHMSNVPSLAVNSTASAGHNNSRSLALSPGASLVSQGRNKLPLPQQDVHLGDARQSAEVDKNNFKLNNNTHTHSSSPQFNVSNGQSNYDNVNNNNINNNNDKSHPSNSIPRQCALVIVDNANAEGNNPFQTSLRLAGLLPTPNAAMANNNSNSPQQRATVILNPLRRKRLIVPVAGPAGSVCGVSCTTPIVMLTISNNNNINKSISNPSAGNASPIQRNNNNSNNNNNGQHSSSVIHVKREELFVCKVEKLPDPKQAKAKKKLRDKQARPAWDSDADTENEEDNKNNNNNADSPKLLVAFQAAKKRLERMQNEAHILCNIAHPNIVGFVDYFFDQKANQQLLFLEYVDGGDLFKEIEKRSKENPRRIFSLESVLHIFVQILLAVEYLHRHNILHRDIKSQNILISKIYFAKLTDFGTSKQFDQDVDREVDNNLQGSPLYIDPQRFQGQYYSQKSEMWSLGVLLYELLSFDFPFFGATLEELTRNIKTKQPRTLRRPGPPIPPDITVLLSSLLCKDPALRPTAKEVLTRYPSIEGASKFYETRLEKFAKSPQSTPADRAWLGVLQDHLALIYNDQQRSVSSQRSRADGAAVRSSMARIKVYNRENETRQSRNTYTNLNNRDDDDDEHGASNSTMHVSASRRGASQRRNQAVMSMSARGDRSQVASYVCLDTYRHQ